MRIWYSGRVQGVGFRITVCRVATGYEVTGTVSNLPDGRVELIAEGTREELEAFGQGILDAGLRRGVNWMALISGAGLFATAYWRWDFDPIAAVMMCFFGISFLRKLVFDGLLKRHRA